MKKITIKRKYLAFPYAIFMLLFVLLPLALIVFYAFTNADGSISLENFINFFTDGVTSTLSLTLFGLPLLQLLFAL